MYIQTKCSKSVLLRNFPLCFVIHSYDTSIHMWFSLTSKSHVTSKCFVQNILKLRDKGEHDSGMLWPDLYWSSMCEGRWSFITRAESYIAMLVIKAQRGTGKGNFILVIDKELKEFNSTSEKVVPRTYTT